MSTYRSALATVIFLGFTVFLVQPLRAQTAGLLTGGAEQLPPITLSVVEPLAKEPYTLKSGVYYKLFFRNIWVDEVVINDIEVRPFGIESLEFDDEGEAEIKFIAIKPGRYELRIPGTTGDSQGVDVIIE